VGWGNIENQNIKRGGGAKHSDIKFSAFYPQLTPECCCPYKVEKKQLINLFRPPTTHPLHPLQNPLLTKTQLLIVNY
jgi:hypothetical protein